MISINVFAAGEKIFAEDVNENFADQKQRLENLVDFYEPHYLPLGLISLWAGPLESVPANWSVCDGSNGTPDLRDRFIIGAGNDYELGDTGGSESVSLTVAQMASHSHGSGTLFLASSGEHAHGYNRRAAERDGEGGGSTRDLLWNRTTTRTASAAGAHTHEISGNSGLTGSGDAHENRPPYYALFYIMLTGDSNA